MSAADGAAEIVPSVRVEERALTSGVVGVLRIDGEGRGLAGGVGYSVAYKRVAGEALLLKSSELGVYAGMRVHVLAGRIRPYVGAGIPVFLFQP